MRRRRSRSRSRSRSRQASWANLFFYLLGCVPPPKGRESRISKPALACLPAPRSPACLPASAVSGGACPRDCSPSRCHRNPQRCLDTGARARARDPPTRSSLTTAAAGEGEGGTKGVARQESPQSTESDGEVPEQASIKARLSPCHRATPACLPRFFWVALFPSLPACPSKTGAS